MNGANEILLNDARESILKKLAELAGQGGLDEAFAAWLLPEEEIGLDLANAASNAAGHVGAARSYQDVAALGFAADAGKTDIQADVLRHDLDWLSGTSPFINNTPAGVSVDPIALLGVSVGVRVLGDSDILRQVSEWISSFISTSYEMRNAEIWHKCLFAAVQRVVGSTPELEVPGERSAADVRVALVSKGLLPPNPVTQTEDERQCLILMKSGEVLAYEQGRLALTLAAYNAVSRHVPSLLAEHSSDDTAAANRKPKMVKVLFLAANPADQQQLQLTKEMREIDRDVHQAEFRENFKFEQQWEVSVKELQGHLMRYKPDIVHFSGHGSSSSEIILQDISGKSHPVPVRALRNLFSALKENIRCVVLNACFSETQAKAIAEHIDCVVGMSKAITDQAAISFASKFYQALAYGKSVQDAYRLGCVQTDMEGLDEQETPKLLHAPSCDPSQVFFVVK